MEILEKLYQLYLDKQNYNREFCKQYGLYYVSRPYGSELVSSVSESDIKISKYYRELSQILHDCNNPDTIHTILLSMKKHEFILQKIHVIMNQRCNRIKSYYNDSQINEKILSKYPDCNLQKLRLQGFTGKGKFIRNNNMILL